MQPSKKQITLVQQYYSLRRNLEQLYEKVDYLELEIRQLELRILDAGCNVSEPDAVFAPRVSPK